MTAPSTGQQTGDMSVGWHLRRTLVLAIPIIIARTAFLIMATVDTLMTGWVASRELAFLGLGVAVQLTLMMVGVGAIQSISILVAQSVGAGDKSACGRIFRAGLVHSLLVGLVIVIASLPAESFFLAIGQSADIARGAGEVSLQFAWGMPGMLLFIAANYMLEATDRPKIGMTIMIVANLVNVPLNAVFAMGLGGFVEPMGASGAIMTSSALRWVCLAAIAVYYVRDIARNGDLYAVVVDNPVSTALREAFGSTGRLMLWIGLPMGLAQGVESAAFASLIFIAGLLGTAGLATHHITMTLTTLMFMIAIGTMAATTIRVGNAVGRGDRLGVIRAGWVGIGLGAAIAVLPTIAYLTIPDRIAGLFTDDRQVLDLAVDTIRVAGILLIFDAMMGICNGALRGVGDVWPAFFIQAGAFWLFAIPLAWYLVVVAAIGPAGLMVGILVGVLISLVLLMARFAIVSRRLIGRI